MLSVRVKGGHVLSASFSECLLLPAHPFLQGILDCHPEAAHLYHQRTTAEDELTSYKNLAPFP